MLAVVQILANPAGASFFDGAKMYVRLGYDAEGGARSQMVEGQVVGWVIVGVMVSQ